MEDLLVKGNQPRILLATGIFFPDVGGPATHVRRIAEHLSSRGFAVTVVAFGSAHAGSEAYRVVRISRAPSKMLAWVRYGFAVLREAFRHDLVYAFDLTTAGVPSALAAGLFRRPFLLRIGGDPIWERVVEHRARFLPMRAYYEQSLHRADRPFLFRLIRLVVNRADRIVTYCAFISEIYERHYGIDASNIVIIKNPVPETRTMVREKDTFTFLFAGRFVSYKNLERVCRAFARVHRLHPEARLSFIGAGQEEEALRRQAAELAIPLSIRPAVAQPELFVAIDASSVALAPALTEFNPNFILESLSSGKPALISRDHGLSIPIPERWQFDPLNDESLFDAMEGMMDPEAYQAALAYVADALPSATKWHEVLDGHERLVRTALART